MKIADLEFYLVDALSARSEGRSLLVRIVTDEGREGWGEAVSQWRTSELAARCGALLPALAGRSVFEIEDLLTLDPLKNRRLACALEMACWDLVGRIARQPLCYLWGGAYRNRIPLSVRLPQATSEEVATAAREFVEQGFYAQILTATGRMEDDLAAATAVREATGDQVALVLDGRGAYPLEAARELCRRIESVQIQYLFDPLPSQDRDQLAALGAQVNVPLGVSRGIASAADLLALVRRQAGAAATIDPQQIGGLVAARKCAAVAEAASLPLSLFAQPSLGVATAAMLHLAASSPSLASAHEFSSVRRNHVLAEPLEIAGGMIAVPESPGLGVEIDRAKLERYQVAGA